MNPTPADVLALHLLYGQPQTIGSLSEALNWPRRMVEQAVTDLRLQGRPVASDGRGVWLAQTAAEMEQTYRALRHRIEAQSVTAWAVRGTIRRMRASEVRQETLWGDAA